MSVLDDALDDACELAVFSAAVVADAALLPKVSEGGIYMIEDLHSAYWYRWGEIQILGKFL